MTAIKEPLTDISCVEQNFTFPYVPHQYQRATVSEATRRECVLLTSKIGEGKSIMSIMLALYHSINSGVEQVLILCPSVIIDQWEEFVNSVKGIDSCLVFRGTPTQRKAMDLYKEPVVIMSYNIFRSDFDRIFKWSLKRKLSVIGDELSLKSFGQTYKKVRQLIYRKARLKLNEETFHYLCAANATPVSDLSQIYLWASIFIPDVYRSFKQFSDVHVESTDYWGKPTAWKNEDLLQENFDIFAIESKNVDLELPDTIHTERPYSLEKKHLALYQDIEDAEFKLLPDNMLENAVEALFSTLQRVVLCPAEFGLNIRSPIFDIIDSKLDQLSDDDSLIIYTRHVSVSEMLHKNYPQSVAAFGTVSAKKKKAGLAAFKAGEAQLMIANLDSLGKGANLQIANHTIFAELPFRSDVLTQAMGRTARQGQKKTCFFDFPIAKGTIQRQIFQRLMDNDVQLLNFNRNKKALKEFLQASKI
jgi:hypothetical protein